MFNSAPRQTVAQVAASPSGAETDEMVACTGSKMDASIDCRERAGRYSGSDRTTKQSRKPREK
eukprot:782385-Pleurochrysis_carterae.AAC.2